MPDFATVIRLRPITDQAKQFSDWLWSETLTQGIRPMLMSIRHPQVTLPNKLIKSWASICICRHDQQKKWAEYLLFFEKSINENYSEATGHPPIELGEGQKPNRF